MGLANLQCFRCEKLGHVAAECDELRRAANKAEHEARISRFVERWINGDITPHQKRDYIKHENKLWYDGKVPSQLA